MDKMEIESAVLAIVRDPDYRPVKPRVIAQRLPPPRPEAAEVRKAVKRLVARGELVYGSNHLVQAAGAVAKPKSTNRVVGVFRRNAKGYGFVRPAGQSPGEGRALDIYIPAEKTADASDGDLVSVRLQKHAVHGEPGPRGEVVEVVQRETHRFVGSYFESRGESLRRGGCQRLRASDPRRRSRRQRCPAQRQGRGRDGPLPLATFIEGEGGDHRGARPAGRAGRRHAVRSSASSICPSASPTTCSKKPRRQAERFDESIPPGPDRSDRRDHRSRSTRSTPAISTTPFRWSGSTTATGGWASTLPTSRISCGRRRRWIARPAQRATSVYLPDRVLPMLPELISNGLASLQPGKVRYTKTAFMEFTADGLRTAADLHVCGDQEPPAVHLRASGRVPGRSASRGAANLDACGLRPARPDARAGDDPSPPPLRPRRAGTDRCPR